MSDTFKHKINRKYHLGLINSVPINIIKYWNRINFEKGYFINLRNIKKEKIINKETINELNND